MSTKMIVPMLYGKLWEPILPYRLPIIYYLLAIYGHILAVDCHILSNKEIRKYDELCVNVR